MIKMTTISKQNYKTKIYIWRINQINNGEDTINNTIHRNIDKCKKYRQRTLTFTENTDFGRNMQTKFDTHSLLQPSIRRLLRNITRKRKSLIDSSLSMNKFNCIRSCTNAKNTEHHSTKMHKTGHLIQTAEQYRWDVAPTRVNFYLNLMIYATLNETT